MGEMTRLWKTLLQPAQLWQLLKETFNSWSKDKVPRHGAALAYYAVLSLVPLLVVIIAMSGLVFGREAAEGHIMEQIGSLVGPQSAAAIKEMIQRASEPRTGIVATIVAATTLLLGASGVFAQLQDSLHSVWGIQPKEGRGIWGLIKDRFISVAALLGTGFLLLVSLALSAALSAFGKWFGGWLPAPEFVLQGLDVAISFVGITGLFALMFKVLPDARIAWSDVWVGAALTAVLFTVGKFAIGLYLGKSDVGSAYGAAGTIVILLVWVYYSSQILLFGAEFTQVYANTIGARIVPSDNAVVADPSKAGGPMRSSPSEDVSTRGRAMDTSMPSIAANGLSTGSARLAGEMNVKSPPWWFGLLVLGISLIRFSRHRSDRIKKTEQSLSTNPIPPPAMNRSMDVARNDAQKVTDINPSRWPPEAADLGRSHRLWWWLATVPLIALLVLGMALSFIDEPLRAYAERELNQRIAGYTVHLGALHLHPIRLSVDLEHVSIVQHDHPDPPVAEVAQWHASIHWRELLSGHLVSDQWMDRPIIDVTRPQAAKEVQDASTHETGWQEAVFALSPFTIYEFRIDHGEITYRENATSKPLHLTELTVRAGNIRNVRSKAQQYPSDVHVEAIVFDRGRVQLDGRADFLAEPTPALNADIRLQDIALADLLPLTAQHQVHVSRGLLSAIGHVEYTSTVQEVRLKHFTMREVKLDFVHAAKTQQKEQETGQQVAHAADQAASHPTLLLRIDQGKIEQSEFGFVNHATNPHYRIFLTAMDVDLENWSNQLSEGTALVRMKALFMGRGATHISGAFRPETKSPDFDLSVKILNTEVKAMNHLLQAYGGEDVASGVFSVFSEIRVKNGKVEGYLKPLFKDVTAYDPEQDRDKGLLHKMIEKTINVLSTVLKNRPRGEVATKADLSGPIDNPRASTWEVVVNLVQNAFFKAILPGFEGTLKKRE
jgi:YihY family inner membrane protein